MSDHKCNHICRSVPNLVTFVSAIQPFQVPFLHSYHPFLSPLTHSLSFPCPLQSAPPPNPNMGPQKCFKLPHCHWSLEQRNLAENPRLITQNRAEKKFLFQLIFPKGPSYWKTLYLNFIQIQLRLKISFHFLNLHSQTSESKIILLCNTHTMKELCKIQLTNDTSSSIKFTETVSHL